MSNEQNRAEALIEKIQTDANAEVDEIRGNAAEQAVEITRNARRNARLKVHEVVKGLRLREVREMAHEAARFETERRKWRQSDEMVALAEGLTHLEAALDGLWADKASRGQWCFNVIEVAQQRLPALQWRLEYPADLDKQEVTGLVAAITAHTNTAPETSAETGLRGGLRVSAGTAVVDGSIAALFADRQNNSARFLSILLNMKDEGTP